MTLLTKTTLRSAWHRLRAGAAFAAELRPRVDVAGTARFMRRGLADLVFPPCCVSCRVEMDAQPDVPLCEDCLSGMEFFADPVCEKCGAPIPYAVAQDGAIVPHASIGQGCFRCAGRKLWFDATVALGLYSGALRDSVLRMKRSEGDSLSLAMGRLLWQKQSERLTKLDVDVVRRSRCIGVGGSRIAPIRPPYWPRSCPRISACRSPNVFCGVRGPRSGNST